MRHMVRSAATIGAAALAVTLTQAQSRAPKFYEDDPIQRVADTQDASRVQERPISLVYDAVVNLFGKPGKPQVGRAASVNTIDEVPDSAWFTNRLGTQEMSAEAIARGPDDDPGPAPGKLLVSRKAMGASAGFTITDSKGKRYFLKFDPPGHPELGTSTEAVVTRIFHAIGYWVPQAVIANIRAEDLEIAPDARVRTPDGGRRAMKRSDIEEQLRRAHRNADGTYRVIAGASVPGRPVDGFLYEGTRPDDPNDVIPHEDRRELRGLRAFSAWVSHTDAKAINSLDTVITDGGRAHVRHYLIDFNAAMGSAGVSPKERRDGYEYIAEPSRARGALLTLGLNPRNWMTIDYPEHRGIGRFESKAFVAEEWRPRVPNPAYIRSRPDDLFWAARKLMAFTDEHVRAAARAGQYSDPASEKYLADTLIERRNKIGRAWLTTVNPVVDVALSGDGTLTFRNAAVQHGFAQAPSSYKAVWHSFNNETGEARQIEETSGSGESLRAPAGLPSSGFIRVDISATGGHQSWASPVHAYFRRTGDGWKLVGFERMPSAPVMRPGLLGAEPVR